MAKADSIHSESVRKITSENAREDSDLPPDSVVVPISQETIWQDFSTAYDSEDSTRACTNPKSTSNPFPWSKTGSASNRVAATNLNSTPIIALPGKIHRPGFCHRPPSIFPRGRNNGSKKTGLADSEPGSPKVSCLGHVLSQRERGRRRIQSQERGEREKKKGVSCCGGFKLKLHRGGGRDKKIRESRTEEAEVRQPPPERSQPSTVVEVRRSTVEEVQQPEKEETKPIPEDVQPSPEKSEVEAAPPAISGMKRFSSGRRAASWGDDVVAENQGKGAPKSD